MKETTNVVTVDASHASDSAVTEIETATGDAVVNTEQRSPVASTLMAIPRSDKKLMEQLKCDLSIFNCNVECGLGALETECSNALIPLKNYDEMTRARRKIAEKVQCVRAATSDLCVAIEELELELKCCPFSLPASVLDQDRPDHIVCLSTQQIENLCKRKSRREFEDRVNAKRRKYADYVPDGGKALPKHDDGVAVYLDVITRLSLVEELSDVIDFPQKKFLSDVQSFKKWFKAMNASDPNRARAYSRLCAFVKDRERAARERKERDLISEDELSACLNVASANNVRELLQNDFVRLCTMPTPIRRRRIKNDTELILMF